MTIAKTRDNLSAIVASLERGEVSEHLIKNRDRVVAKIVPVNESRVTAKRIGIAKEDLTFHIDDELFDALDAVIAQQLEV